MKSRGPKIAIAVFVGLVIVTGLSSLVLIGWSYWQIYGIGGWRDQVFADQGLIAADQALRDFQERKLRLFCLGGETEGPKYTGTNEGPFEVWLVQYYPSLGSAHRYSIEQFIHFYNGKMRYMQAHPDKFRHSSDSMLREGTTNTNIGANKGTVPGP